VLPDRVKLSLPAYFQGDSVGVQVPQLGAIFSTLKVPHPQLTLPKLSLAHAQRVVPPNGAGSVAPPEEIVVPPVVQPASKGLVAPKAYLISAMPEPPASVAVIVEVRSVLYQVVEALVREIVGPLVV